MQDPETAIDEARQRSRTPPAEPDSQSSPARRLGFKIRLLAILAAVAVLLLARTFRQPQGPRPDIILLTVDTLRTDRLGAYGHQAARTPNIDRLARRGMMFTQATTPFPRTTPALASLLSGLWPQHHGSREVSRAVGDVPLMPELLRPLGYLTLGVCANGSVSRRTNFDRGFDHFLDDKDIKIRDATNVTRQALELLRHSTPDQPLFLWVHYIDPHFPYRVHEGWLAADSGPCLELTASVQGEKPKVGHVTSDRDGKSSRARDSCLELYDGEVAHVDEQLGELLAGLRSLRPLSRELIIFTADHGENFGEDGLFFQHGPNVHDASLRVPLLISGPGIAEGVDDGVARLEDILPTLLDLLAEPARRWPRMDGKRLSRRLGGLGWAASKDDRVALAESGSALLLHSFRYVHSGRTSGRHCINGPRFSLCGEQGAPGALFDHQADPDLLHDLSAQFPEEKKRLEKAREIWPPEQPRERTVRTLHYKLVERPRLRGGYRRYLYDLEADPLAEHDISAANPDIVARLEKELVPWTAELPPVGVAPRSTEQLETLRALGYVD